MRGYLFTLPSFCVTNVGLAVLQILFSLFLLLKKFILRAYCVQLLHNGKLNIEGSYTCELQRILNKKWYSNNHNLWLNIKRKNEANKIEGEMDINIRWSEMVSQWGYISAKSWWMRRTQSNLYWDTSPWAVPKSNEQCEAPQARAPFVLLTFEKPSLTAQLTHNYLHWISLFGLYFLTLCALNVLFDLVLDKSSFSNSEEA